jgi:opacity protein-like surface antigen
MIRKFATVPQFRVALVLILVTILAGATMVHAQQTPASQLPAQQPPAQQPPAQPQSGAQQTGTQQSGTQEASTEDTSPTRKLKVKDYKNWTFNAGGGANLTNGTTRTFVRGGGGAAAAGVARNYSKYFGFRLDFQFDNLPLRNSALELAQAPGATSHVYSVMLDPIINVPVTKAWGGYILAGPSFFHRSGKLDSSTAIPGSACNTFFTWWGTCFNSSLPLNGKFLNASQNEFGENFGGGVTRKIRPNIEIYAEFRYLHGKRSGITTDLRPITVGVRW